MNKKNAALIAIVVILAAGAGYYYWQQMPSESAPVQRPAKAPAAQAAPASEAKPAVQAPVAAPALPKLVDSDRFVLDALAGLIGDASLMKLLHTERVIHNIVATIDGLPGERAPLSVMPLRPVPGAFITEGGDDNKIIGRKNAARYAPYMKLAQAVDSKRLVDLYVRLYPLFQEAYEALGYPHGYFNDRLMETLDDLLEAPDIKAPVKLVQTHVMYQYADPELEACSAGQKIIMRMGSSNAAKIKAQLREIKQEIVSRLRDGKVQ